MTPFRYMLLYYAVTVASILSSSGGAVKLDLSISGEHMYYIEDLSLGTPPQPITNIIVDSGSSDLMIVESIYNASVSSSFVDTNQSFFMRYGFDDPFPVFKIYENIESPEFKLFNLTMGYAHFSDIQSFSGVLGIGFTGQELFGTNYSNFPYLLKEQGLTKSVLFSFNGQDGNYPAIIFGGLSTNIIDGPLVKVPFVKAIGLSGQLDYWLIPAFTVNEVKLDDVVISNQNTLYQIDSGSNGFLPPEPVLDNLVSLLGNNYIESDDGYAYYDIKDIEEKELKFNVQGFEIGFALTDIIGETVEKDGNTYVALNLASYNIGYDSFDAVLPNLIFKYYYGIFDYENYQVYFGKYKELAGQGNVIPIVDGDNLPYPTIDVPDQWNTYSVIYDAESETTVVLNDTETTTSTTVSTEINSLTSTQTSSTTFVNICYRV